jgi:hypothetical protein
MSQLYDVKMKDGSIYHNYLLRIDPLAEKHTLYFMPEGARAFRLGDPVPVVSGQRRVMVMSPKTFDEWVESIEPVHQ